MWEREGEGRRGRKKGRGGEKGGKGRGRTPHCFLDKSNPGGIPLSIANIGPISCQIL